MINFPKAYEVFCNTIKFCRLSKQIHELPSACLWLPRLTNAHGKSIRKNYRAGSCVDQFWTQPYIDYYSTHAIFTPMDCLADNVVNVPSGFMLNDNISQSKAYCLNYAPKLTRFNKVFWKGSAWTHEIRPKVVRYLKSKRDVRFVLRNWTCTSGNPYGAVKPPSIEYTSYFEQLSHADLFLVMRGDRPWLYSFFDCLRAGAIPVCIDTFYGNLGWEKIGIAPDDILLDLDTSKHGLEGIYQAITSLLENKEKLLHMKATGQQFFQKYVLTDGLVAAHGASIYFSGWGDFIVAKALEIARNNYKLDNTQFISPLVHEVKDVLQSQKTD